MIDAGCGSGRVTEALLERLPRGRVIAVDASASMVQAARERLAGAGIDTDRVEVREGDLLELEVDEPVDAILSTATFHWIADHDALFRRLRAVLCPGGGWSRSVGGRATSTCCAGSPTRSWSANRTPSTSATGGRRGTTRAPRPPVSACSARASPPQSAGCSRPRSSPSTRVSSSPRSCSAPTFSSCPMICASRSWTTVLAELGEPVVVDYIRLNLDAVA